MRGIKKTIPIICKICGAEYEAQMEPKENKCRKCGGTDLVLNSPVLKIRLIQIQAEGK